MATHEVRTETSLRIERTLAAPPGRVFEAWTKAEALARWMAPTEDYVVVVSDLDLKPGGRWRLEMRHKGGAVHPVGGVYRTILAPSKLAFTWAWEDDPSHGESLVTVEFHAQGTGTRLVMLHELLVSAESREKHGAGWDGCLARLERLF